MLVFYDKMTKQQLIEEIIKKDREIAELRMLNDIDEIPSCEKSLKKSRLELLNQRSTLDAILDASRDGILVVDNYGRIIHKNNRFIEIFNIPDDKLKEKYALNLAGLLKDRLTEPDKFVLQIKNTIDKPEEKSDVLYFKNGRIIERFFAPLIMDNEFKGRVWIFRDVTARMNLENELKRSERVYRKLMELLPIGIIVYEDKKVAIINGAGAKLFGFENPLEAIGKSFGSLAKTKSAYGSMAMERMRKLNQSESVVEPQAQKIFLANGETAYVEVSGFSFRYENEHLVTLIIKDISEHKKVEELHEDIRLKDSLLKEAKEYNQLKTRLFTTISHELKTPLNIIVAVIQLMHKFHDRGLECPFREHYDRHMRILKQNSYRLMRLINNVVDANRIEIGFLKMNPRQYDIISIVEDIVQSVVEYTRSKGLDIVFDTQIEERVMVFDAEKIERVMLNLLSNAIKFTEPGGIIEVNMYEEDGFISISVKDTGIGIPEDMLDKIFDPFRQVDSSLRRNAEGSGIGLSLVKSLVQMHGGSITVTSEYGKGSEFIVELPVNLGCDDGIAAGKSAAMIEDNAERIHIEFSDIYL